MTSQPKTKLKHILRDNIEGITKPALQRLAYRAGIKQMSAKDKDDFYAYSRGILHDHLDQVVRNSLIFMKNAKHSTLSSDHVRRALESMGRPISFSDIQTVLSHGKKHNRTVKKVLHKTGACGVYPTHPHPKSENMKGGGDESESESESEEEEEEEEGISDEESIEQMGGAGKIHYYPGTVVNRKIKHYQKHGEHCFELLQQPFNRLVREISQDYSKNGSYGRFSRDALATLQIDAEKYLISIYQAAQNLAEKEHKVRVGMSDLEFVTKLIK